MNRPDADNVELVDDEIADVDAHGASGSRAPGPPILQSVVLHSSVIDDIVIDIEAAVRDDSRDSNESAFWDAQAWSDHFESLLSHAYEDVSVTFDEQADAYRIDLGRARSGGAVHDIAAALRGFGPTPEPVLRHENPDGTFGGLVSATATVERTAWVGPLAKVLGRAKVLDSAKVLDQAIVSDDATVTEHAVVRGRAQVLDNATVAGHATVSGNAVVRSEATVSGGAMVFGRAKVTDLAIVSGAASIGDDVVIAGQCVVSGQASIGDLAQICGNAQVTGEAVVSGRAVIDGERVLAGCEVA
ncbi:MAG: hypothetical protein M0010_06965 [Actinomycetota bacterium]|nr:hypothetical protein [Actinomycetota bacterium]